MDSVFEIPKEEVVNVPVKKERKKRKPMSEEAKKAFVERMRASRKKKMEDKIRKEMETSSGSPLKKTETAKEIVQNVVNSPESPATKVPHNSPVKSEPRQPQPIMDYSHFHNLTDNIRILNDTLSQIGKHSAPAPVPVPAKPVKVIDDTYVASPTNVSAPEPVPKPNTVPRTVPKPNNVPSTVPVPTPKPEKRKVWNCSRKCYVYM